MSPFVIVSCALIIPFVVNCTDGFRKLIVKGSDAEISEFPFQVSLRFGKYGNHICAGSIMNSMWILTAAHCIITSKPRKFTVQYGVTTITRTGANIVNVSKIVVHPGYYGPTAIHDIALIRLKEPIEFGESAQPVGLPRMFQSTKAGTRADLAGWGRNATFGELQERLQKVELAIISKERCSVIYPKQTYVTNICAGSRDVKGACNGDSGGALIASGVQVGIASFTYRPCAWFPTVFTEVSNYIDWIEDTIEKNV